MRTREFWTLDEDDRHLISRLAPGLGEDPARVLAYLLLRSDVKEEPATQLTLRIGTGLNRNALATALDKLESGGVVERTTVQDSTRGRPPTAWRTTMNLESSIRQVYQHHATTLVEHARELYGVSRQSEPPASGDPLALGLNWQANGLHVPFYNAVPADGGGEPIVDIEHYEGSHRALEAVLSGESDVGLVGAATVVRARASGDPVVPIAVAYQCAMAVLYTVREVFGEPLSSVEQLRGRRIGMPASSEMRLLGRLFLTQAAVADDARIIDTAGEEQDALLAERVDVVTGSFSDPRRLEREGMTVDTLTVADHFPIYGPTLVAREETLAARERTLTEFLAETTARWAEARLDPTAAVERIADLSGDPPERVRRTFEAAAHEFGESEAVREDGWGTQREATWDRLRTALKQGSLLPDSGAA